MVILLSELAQGQQKTYLLALKLAQFDFMQEIGYKPMLLLDDIFDKLDDNRVEHLMKLVDQHHFGQIFVTDTHLKFLNKSLIRLMLITNCFT